MDFIRRFDLHIREGEPKAIDDLAEIMEGITNADAEQIMRKHRKQRGGAYDTKIALLQEAIIWGCKTWRILSDLRQCDIAKDSAGLHSTYISQYELGMRHSAAIFREYVRAGFDAANIPRMLRMRKASRMDKEGRVR